MMKQVALRLAISERIAYHRDQGFRTPKTVLLFKVLGDFTGGVSKLVGRDGFEPSTNWLTANCSTN